MSTLGKVFLAVNLLAAGGLTWAAGTNWARRQDLTAAVVKHRLALGGLPVAAPAGDADPSAVPLGLATPGGYVVATVRPELLAAYFRGADGGDLFGGAGSAPPSSQVAEVARVRAKAGAVLAGAGGDGARVVLLCGEVRTARVGDREVVQFEPGWLARMAESFEERELLRRMADGPTKEAADRAEAMLGRRFEAAVNPPDPRAAAAQAGKVTEAVNALRAAPQDADARRRLEAALADPGPAAARDDADRRHRIAHLLIHLDPSSAWQDRVARVVGLGEYRAAVAAHADRLRDMARSGQRALEVDQAAYVERYEQLRALALDRALLLARQREHTAALKAQQAAAEEAVKSRAKQLDDRSADLAKLRGRVQDAVADQARAEAELFDIQRRVGEAFRDLYRREAELAGRPPAPAPPTGSEGR